MPGPPTILRAVNPTPARQSTARKGGIPSGPLEVPWWSENFTLADAGLVAPGDHADLGRAFAAAVGHLLANLHHTALVLGAGCGVLTGQRSKGADRAERNDEE